MMVMVMTKCTDNQLPYAGQIVWCNLYPAC